MNDNGRSTCFDIHRMLSDFFETADKTLLKTFYDLLFGTFKTLMYENYKLTSLVL